MNWVMLIMSFIATGAGASVEIKTIEFRNEALCEKAIEKIENDPDQSTRIGATFICLKRDNRLEIGIIDNELE